MAPVNVFKLLNGGSQKLKKNSSGMMAIKELLPSCCLKHVSVATVSLRTRFSVMQSQCFEMSECQKSKDSHMKGLFPLVFSRTSCPVSSSVLSISDSGYQKAHVPLGRSRSVIFTNSGLFTIAESRSSDRRSDVPLASVSGWNRSCT